MKDRLLLILNPISGRLKGVANEEALCQALGSRYEVTVMHTAARGDGTRLAREHLASFDAVAGCGGDGTLNEVMEALRSLPPEARKPMLCIPAGTTNLLGDTLCLPHNVVAAAERLAAGVAHPFDLGRINEFCFGSVASFGAFTDSSYATPQKLKNRLGYGAYVLGGAKGLFHLQNYRMTVECNGETFTDDFVFGGVSNCVAVGGIIRFPDGTVQVGDGRYEVVLVRRLKSLAALARVMRAVRRRNYANCPEVFYAQTDRIRLSADQALPWTIDGEYKGDIAQADIEILPAALQLVW